MPASDEAALVAVLLPPPEAATVAVACWDEGVAVAPLDPGAPAPELRRALDVLRPTELWDGDGRRRWDRSGGGSGGVPVAAGVAAVVLTSGTSGEPKGAELTFSGLAASGTAVTEAAGAEAGDGWLCCLPLHHVAGLAVVGRAWATGAPVVVQAGFRVEQVAGPVFVSLVPTMLARLLDAGAAVERFRGILLGGGPIDPALRERAEAAGAAVSTTYGMTETWGGIVHDGHPLREVELRLDGDGAEGGEILVRAPMVMRGYRLRPDLTSAVLSADGWYRTGDAGRFDPLAGGRLRLVDRLGDMIKTGGVKVAPTEVERVLAAHPGVADVCVAARPDPEWGERVVAFVVPRDAGAPPVLAELRAFALERLAAPKAPRELVLVEAIPRSAGGKPLRRLLPLS